MHTYRNTSHLGITPRVGDNTDKGCVILITEDGRIVTDKRGQERLSAEAVYLVSRRRTMQ